MKRIFVIGALFSFLIFSPHSKASGLSNDASGAFHHPFYAGILAGYGSTLWGGLVPPKKKQIIALMISTPTEAQEGGMVAGIYAGYEFIPNFALEANYMRYPNAKICFAQDSLFAFYHEGRTEFVTKTETLTLSGKFMFLIPHSAVRAFSGVGAAGIHRSDEINDRWRVAPAFLAGFNYNFTEHFMGEIVVDYVSGYGISELEPTIDYIPFLVSGTVRLAYRF